MHRSYRTVLVLLGLVFWLVASTATAQSFDAATRTVTVAPTGVDDTLALRTAFDVCLAVGPGCTVQLEAGVFHAQQLEVWGFDGTFAGAGMGATIVEALAPLPISPPNHDIAVSYAEPEGGPVLVSFRNAHMTMRDLTLRNAAAVPTTGWRFGGNPLTALAVLLVLEGDDLRVDVERVAIESVAGLDGAASVLNGVWIQGVEAFPGGPIADTVGSITIRESRIAGPEFGLVIQDVAGLAVRVRDNELTGIVAVDVWNAGGALLEVRGNEIVGVERAVSVTVDPMGRLPSEATSVLVIDNRLRTTGGGGVAVGLKDGGPTPTQSVFVERNAIELADAASLAVGGEAEGVVVRDNVIVGAARTAVLVRNGAATAPRPWLLVGNDFASFEARDAAVTIMPRTRGTVVVCGGAPAAVRDLGEGSLIACD